MFYFYWTIIVSSQVLMHSHPTRRPASAPGGVRVGLTEEQLPYWRPLDEAVTVTFSGVSAEAGPRTLRWRGSHWDVVGTTLHWGTWHALPVEPVRQDLPPTSRRLSTDFWRFAAQTSRVSPIFFFEIRGNGNQWRLVRLGAVFDLPSSP